MRRESKGRGRIGSVSVVMFGVPVARAAGDERDQNVVVICLEPLYLQTCRSGLACFYNSQNVKGESAGEARGNSRSADPGDSHAFRFLWINFSATPLLHQRFPVGGGRPYIENVAMVAGGACFSSTAFASTQGQQKRAGNTLRSPTTCGRIK